MRTPTDPPADRPATLASIAWDRVRALTFVPFVAVGEVALVVDGDRLRLPTGRVQPGEDAFVAAATRIPLEVAGFRRQNTHLLDVDAVGTHVSLWVDGARYRGSRAHNADAEWWTGSPSAVADALAAQGDSKLAALVRAAGVAEAALTDEQYFADSQLVLDAAYLRATTAEGGSGFGGTAAEWFEQRSMLCDAIERDGTFLDVGCANGHLMESIVEWCAARGVAVEPYGVDISESLVVTARTRLPQWADRIWVGNALSWMPPPGLQFDVVHVLLDAVPEARYGDLVDHLLETAVAPGGRLLVSYYDVGADHDWRAAAQLEHMGVPVDGETRVPTRNGQPWGLPSAWVTKT